MRINLCNEVIRGLPFADQCKFTRAIGYDGLEIAPFTLCEDPRRLRISDMRRIRSVADHEGAPIGGLHWLLTAPEGLSITSDDQAVTATTLEVGRRLIDLCKELGGAYLVHGSPSQRVLEGGREAEGRQRAAAYFAAMAQAAMEQELLYIIEPLSRADTSYITSVDEAVGLIRSIGSDALGTMIDCYAAARNGEDVAGLIERWLPEGAVRHIHFNDPNKRGPGEGTLRFKPILDMLRRLDYSGRGGALRL